MEGEGWTEMLACIKCGLATERGRAVVWNGEYFVMVTYNVSFPAGPYCVTCIGSKLNELNGSKADPRELLKRTQTN